MQRVKRVLWATLLANGDRGGAVLRGGAVAVGFTASEAWWREASFGSASPLGSAGGAVASEPATLQV